MRVTRIFCRCHLLGENSIRIYRCCTPSDHPNPIVWQSVGSKFTSRSLIRVYNEHVVPSAGFQLLALCKFLPFDVRLKQSIYVVDCSTFIVFRPRPRLSISTCVVALPICARGLRNDLHRLASVSVLASSNGEQYRMVDISGAPNGSSIRERLCSKVCVLIASLRRDILVSVT